MKSERHAKILEIIRKNEVETQEELSDRLEREGFQVTQATVSRDIHGHGTEYFSGPYGVRNGNGSRSSIRCIKFSRDCRYDCRR